MNTLRVARRHGQGDVRSLITHRFPLEKTGEAFAVAQRREGIKVMVKC